MKDICADLKSEHQALDEIVSGLSEEQWATPTPSPGWNIRDQIRHLAYFDDRAALSVTDPEAFQAHLEEIFADIAGFIKKLDDVGRDLSTAELLEWWRSERTKMLEAYLSVGPKTRLLWYGRPMSALSSATARLMETWAHGQDVFDALKIKRANTDSLRHIAYLGVNTFGWSFANRGLEVPQVQVRVELTSPSGQVWAWGPEDSAERVTGPAEGFCLVVAQRRHVDDTDLVVVGETARDWMEKAQCFAGPATDGPQAGERVVTS